MKRTPLWILLAIVVTLLASSLLWNFSMRAAPQPGRGAQDSLAPDNRVTNFDIRNGDSKETILKFERRLEKFSSQQKENNASFKLAMDGAREKKARRVDGLEATFSDLTYSPEVVRGNGRKFLTPASLQPRASIVRGFLNDNNDLFGLHPQEVARLRKTAEYTNPNGRLSWVMMAQEWNGMKVFGGEIVAAFTSKGELAQTAGTLTPGPGEQELATVPSVSAAPAVVAAAAYVGVTLPESDLIVSKSSQDGRTVVFHPTGPFKDGVELELQYFPLGARLATLAWSTVLWGNSLAYYILVDALTGELLFCKSLINEQTQPATYGVYDGDSPAPLSPTTALPGSGIQGAAIPRTLFTLISEGAFNNLGWLADGVNTTTGNNVDAGLDLDFLDGIDPNGRPTGSPFRVFDFNYNPAPGIPPPGDAPTLADYRFGEVVNMFFWTNRYHDRLYELGFTEAARNFQNDNFGRGGVGNDHVLAQSQDFSGTSNANFATPPDGFSGRMQMFIFNGPDPDRSSGLDQEILIHELTHGTSNRLHNNAAGLNTIMSGGMGEGWSDFYGLALLAQPGDDPHGVYAVGGYSTLQIVFGFTDNYYYGIRRFPHATISTVGPNGKPHNPLTFADIDPAQINLTDGAFPRGPIGSSSAFAVHNIGEVWCAALWEVRARIIDRIGFADGNQRTLQLVTDGMKLDPVNPTLLDGRNSILTASCAAFDGEDELDIWAGFAARGMGVSASAVSSSSPAVVEAFDMPNLNLGAVTISDDSCAPPDGFADPGESLTLNIPLSNPFCATAANGVTISVNGGAPVSYEDISAGATVSRGVPFTVPSDAGCGSQIPVEVVITSSLGTVTRTFNLQIGRPVITLNASYSSGNIAVPIPEVGVVDIPINVTDVGAVVDVNVRLRLNHTFDGDLALTLIGPDGTSVALANNRGSNGQNFGIGSNDCSGSPTVFDDSAPTPIGVGVAPFVGSFKPDSPLSAFSGKLSNGLWRLRIDDRFTGDSGIVGCVTLEITRHQFACCGAAPPIIEALPFGPVQDESCFARNDAPDPDETLTVNFALHNIGETSTTNLIATLLPTGGVLAPSGPQNYGVLVPGSTAVSRQFTFTVAGVCGGDLTATLALQDGAIDLGTVTFTVRIGQPGFCCISPCTLNTPPNIVVNSDPGVCGAFVNYPAPTFTGSCGVVTSTPPSGSFFPVGTTTVTVRGIRQDGTTTLRSFTVTVNTSSTVTVSSVAGQFSDLVTLRANVTNTNCPSSVAEFKVNGSVVGSAPVVGGAATLPHNIFLAQGSYPITATLSSSSVSGSGTLTVTKEDATVTPSASNPTAVKVNAPRGTAGPINLCAAINEPPDGNFGDISLATPVTFTLTPFAVGASPITQTSTTSGGGFGGTLTACVALTNVSVNVYNVAISVGGNNYTGSGSAAPLAIFDPSLKPFKGVGSIIRSGSSATFLFNVKHKNGNPQGGLIYAERRPNGRATLQSNAIQAVSIIGNTGIIVGRATVNGVANHTFRATVIDGGKSARNDRFGLQVISPSGAIVQDLTFDPVTLKGGNIKR